MTYALIVILPIALFYLGSRAMITGWLWSRYPRRFAYFMDCAACSGFWYGALVQAGLLASEGNVGPAQWISRIGLTGLVALVTTPIGAAVMQRAMTELGTTIDD